MAVGQAKAAPTKRDIPLPRPRAAETKQSPAGADRNPTPFTKPERVSKVEFKMVPAASKSEVGRAYREMDREPRRKGGKLRNLAAWHRSLGRKVTR